MSSGFPEIVVWILLEVTASVVEGATEVVLSASVVGDVVEGLSVAVALSVEVGVADEVVVIWLVVVVVVGLVTGDPDMESEVLGP